MKNAKRVSFVQLVLQTVDKVSAVFVYLLFSILFRRYPVAVNRITSNGKFSDIFSARTKLAVTAASFVFRVFVDFVSGHT